MIAYIVEDPRYRLSNNHLSRLEKVFKEVRVFRFTDGYRSVVSSCGEIILTNTVADWTLYSYVFDNHRGSGVAIINSTFFYKHPWRFILSQYDPMIMETLVPTVFGVVRHYRNGLISSPGNGYIYFISSFFVVFNNEAVNRLFSKLSIDVTAVKNDEKIPFNYLSSNLYSYAYNHTHSVSSSYSHVSATSSNVDYKVAKMKSVICEHIMSDSIFDNCLVETANATLSQRLRYLLFSIL